MKDSISISVDSTSNANGIEGEKRCIYDEILKDFQHIYNLNYLVQFFEEKAREYFRKSVADDEKFYQSKKQSVDDDEFESDFSIRDNYFSVLQIVWIVKTLKAFYDIGYKFEVVKITSENNGWIMKFVFDFSNLTKEQAEIIYMNAFEVNQFDPDKIFN